MMSGTTRLVVAGTLCAGLAACAAPNSSMMDSYQFWTKDEPAARTMEPQGSEFSQGLREGYFKYADAEAGTFDSSSSRHFTRKAVAAAKSHSVDPDLVELRTIPAEHVDELDQARSRLMAALNATARQKAPAAASRAQTAFDCWLEEQEEGTSDEAIAACRAEFEQAIAEAEAALTSTLDNVYLVFFAWDRSELSPVAVQAVDEVVADYDRGEASIVHVDGHADSSGSQSYNVGLSERRARSTAVALTSQGVASSVLDVQWFGESQPRVPTADGVREPQNRRVEITFE